MDMSYKVKAATSRDEDHSGWLTDQEKEMSYDDLAKHWGISVDVLLAADGAQNAHFHYGHKGYEEWALKNPRLVEALKEIDG